MSARDDYPILARLSNRYPGPPAGIQIDIAFDEIDSLRRWKSEALQVLQDWEAVWIAAGCPGPLGSPKADSVRRLFERRPNQQTGGR
jgi:hypothetical protein